MRHTSTQIVHLPAAGLDPQADIGVARGLYRDLTRCAVIAGRPVKLKPGEKAPKGCPEIRIGRTKGVTYRRYSVPRKEARGKAA